MKMGNGAAMFVTARVIGRPIAGGCVALWMLCGAAAGQDAAAPVEPAMMAGDRDAPEQEQDRFTPEELDALTAPIALYPDSLLAQVFVAATVPLDVVKAGQMIGDKADLTPDARADAIDGEDWDESVQVLAAGFPSVIERMAGDIDWTEQLGDAVLAQTDDVLASIQRLRAQAEATGNLDSNTAQTVSTKDGAISIAPADPEVVYVPTYDTKTVYTTAPTAPAVVAEPGMTTGDILTTGAVVFGGALLVDALFDDDDDWDDYWRGPPRIDWDDGDFRPRPDVDIDVDGDVNVNRGRFTRNDIDRDRINRASIDRDAMGGIDRDRHPGSGNWHPTAAQRDAARDKISTRRGGETGARHDALKAGGGSDARAKLSKAAANHPPKARDGRPETAFKPQAASRADVGKAKERASAHQAKLGGKGHPAAAKAQGKNLKRPAATKGPIAHKPGKSTVFEKQRGKPHTAAARGKASHARHRR